MKDIRRKRWMFVRPVTTITCFVFVLFFALLCVNKEGKAEKLKTIRVGYYQVDGYHELDAAGKRWGYGYEFLQKIGRYLPYKYEYVGYEKNWQDMLEMLEKGEIDLLTGGGKTEEREKQFGFSESAIGTNITTLTVREGDDRFKSGDYTTYDGMKIGFVNKTFRAKSFRAFAKEHDFTYTAVYRDNFEELQTALQAGEIDGIISTNLRKLKDEVVLDQFDYSDFYVMTRKEDQELLNDINNAISQLDKDEPGWRTSLLSQFYGKNSQSALALTSAESEYLQTMEADGAVLKVLVNPDRKPYSYFEDGEAKGIIPSIFSSVADRLGISYEILATENREEYEQKLRSGEIDICVDMGYDYSVAEDCGYELTDPYMSTGFSRITRKNDGAEVKTVASIKSSYLMSDYLEERYEPQDIRYYDSIKECVDAVKDSEVDSAFLYTYTAQQIMNEDIRNRFDSVIASGEFVSFAIGVRQDLDSCLLTALNKVVQNMKSTEVDGIILDAAESLQVPMSLTTFLYYNPVYGMILMAIFGIVALIVGVAVVSLRNQKKLQAAYEEVQAANNAKRDFLSKMSHDIRTPMNAIMGMTELIERHAGDRTVVEDYLKKLRISEKYLLTLLNAILDMGRIDSGKIELEHTFFSLKDMAEEVAVILHDMVDQKTQEFRIDIRDVRHIFVAGDKRKLEQTLINLLTNASNFTPQNGKILLRIEEEEEGNFVFTVKDNGIGIPEDQKKHIFEAFSRVEDSRTSAVAGTGLGLSIVKSYVDMAGGTIQVESEPGKGTEFILRIPLEIQSNQALPKEEMKKTGIKDNLHEKGDLHEKDDLYEKGGLHGKNDIQEKDGMGENVGIQEEEEPDLLGGLRVLLVEDNELNREIAQELLETMGAEVHCAENGKEAVDQFTASGSGTYDVVLMDLQMPVMDGLEACRQIRGSGREDKNIPIFALSANDGEEDIRNIREVGMNGHLSKPFDVDKIYQLLKGIEESR